MHPRESDFFSFGPIHGSDAGPRELTFDFELGGIGFAQSADGWFRARISLDSPLDAPDPSRSWALDPVAAAGREWYRAEVDGPDTVSDHWSRRHSPQNEAIEGNENPHEDTRGVIPVRATGHRFQFSTPSATGDEFTVARTRDGVLLDFPLPEEAHIYGLGEKTGELDKRGRSWTMWNTDEPDHTPYRDPLYQSIPVAYLFQPGRIDTVFVDSTAATYFDCGESRPDRLLIEVYDTEFEVYLRSDASLAEAVTAYTGLTGRMPLPPEWALGYHQCRYSYFPAARVMEIARRLQEEEIPSDVIYLDIHYMDEYRVFTWDRRRFPDPTAMIADLRELGFHLVTIVDPGVKADTDYPPFAEGVARGVFLSEPTGLPYIGAVWPGKAAFPDFTSADARSWWADAHATLLQRGVSGIWNDMNEPADFTGPDEYRPDFTVPDRLRSAAGSLARLHNAYANGMNRATREALRRFRPDERGFVLTRAGYAGVQRDAAVWTGDNASWWEHISGIQPMLMNLGISGVAFAGGDVGGFQLNASAEMYARWIAAASLMPFFRGHSALDTVDHEPWAFGPQVLAVARRFVGLRYRLMPYLYTLFHQASQTGVPVMRPLVWEFPHDPRVHNRADSFMVGPGVLAAPVSTPGVQERSVYLPAGVWYDAWTGRRIDSGDPRRPDSTGHVIAIEAPIDQMPLFIRGGSIIPTEAPRRHTGEPGNGTVTMLLAPDHMGTAGGALYADAGEGHGYRRGEFTDIEMETSADRPTEIRAGLLHGSGSEAIRFQHLAAAPVSAVADVLFGTHPSHRRAGVSMPAHAGDSVAIPVD